MSKRALPLFEKFLRYDADTGFLYWIVPGLRREVGQRADHNDARGYMRVFVDVRWHQAHRVAWFLTMGREPENTIDHKNRNPADNRWCNLREATQVQNNANRRAYGAWPKGVALHRTGRFQAQISSGGKNHYLGLFDTPEAARAAYLAVAVKIYGEFARPS